MGHPTLADSPDWVDWCADTSMRFLAHHTAREENHAEISWGLEAAVHWFTTLYTVGALGRPVQIVNQGVPTTLQPEPLDGVRSSSRYRLAWGLAWLRRSIPLREVLAECTHRVCTNQPGVVPSSYSVQVTEMYELFDANAEHWPDVCRDTLALMEPFITGNDKRYNIQSYSILRLMQAFQPGHQHLFDDRLFEALEAQFILDRLIGFIDKGAIPWEVLGLVAKAHDLGIPIGVESNYLPGWMVRGEWPEVDGV